MRQKASTRTKLQQNNKERLHDDPASHTHILMNNNFKKTSSGIGCKASLVYPTEGGIKARRFPEVYMPIQVEVFIFVSKPNNNF